MRRAGFLTTGRKAVCKCRAIEQPIVAIVVVYGEVQGRTVVPDDQVAVAPTMTTAKIRLSGMPIKSVQNGFALRLAIPLNPRGVDRVNEKGPEPILRMPPHYWMKDFSVGGRIVAHHIINGPLFF